MIGIRWSRWGSGVTEPTAMTSPTAPMRYQTRIAAARGERHRQASATTAMRARTPG